jgi:hypothetical protein
MMKLTLRKLTGIAVVGVTLAIAPGLKAAQFTNFLETLNEAITNQLTTNTDLTANQTKALNSAAATVNRESKTLSTDLKLLTTAATTLDRAFTNAEDLVTAEQSTLDDFFNEAENRLEAVQANASLITNPPPNVANALTQAVDALTTAEANSNGVVSASRDLSYALVKIAVADKQVSKSIKAPLSLEGKTVTGVLKAPEEKPLKFTLGSDGTYALSETNSGTWAYQRLSANTGTITLSKTNEPPGDTVLDLTFKSTKKATFTSAGDVTGTVSIK